MAYIPFKSFVYILGLSLCFQAQGVRKPPDPYFKRRGSSERGHDSQRLKEELHRLQREMVLKEGKAPPAPQAENPSPKQSGSDPLHALKGASPRGKASRQKVSQRLSPKEIRGIESAIGNLESQVTLSNKVKKSIDLVMQNSPSLRKILRKLAENLSSSGSSFTKEDILTISWYVADLKGLVFKLTDSNQVSAQKVKGQLEEEVRVIQQWIRQPGSVDSRMALDFLYEVYSRKRDWGNGKLSPKEVNDIFQGLKMRAGQDFEKEFGQAVLVILKHLAYGSLVGRDLKNLLLALSENPLLVSSESMATIIWQTAGLRDLVMNANQPFAYEANRVLVNEMLRLHQVIMEVLTVGVRDRLNALNQNYVDWRRGRAVRDEDISDTRTKEVERSEEPPSPVAVSVPVKTKERQIIDRLARDISILREPPVTKAVEDVLSSHPEVKKAFEDLVTLFETNPRTVHSKSATILIRYIQYASESPIKVPDILRLFRSVTQTEPLGGQLLDLLFEFYVLKGSSVKKHQRLWNIVYGQRIRENFTEEETARFQELGKYPSIRELQSFLKRAETEPNEAEKIAKIFLEKADIFISQEEAKTVLAELIRSVSINDAQYIQKFADKIEKEPSIISEEYMQTVVWFMLDIKSQHSAMPSIYKTFFNLITDQIPSHNGAMLKHHMGMLHNVYRFSRFDFNLNQVDFVPNKGKRRNSLGEIKEEKIKRAYEESIREQQRNEEERQLPDVGSFREAELLDVMEQLLSVMVEKKGRFPIKIRFEDYELHEQAFFRSLSYDKRVEDALRKLINALNNGHLDPENPSVEVFVVNLFNLGFFMNKESHPPYIVREAEIALQHIADSVGQVLDFYLRGGEK